MYKIVLGALGALCVCASSSAQTGAPAQTAAPIAANDAQRFVDVTSAFSASLSPDGNAVAYIARDDQSERVIIVDVTTHQRVGLQMLPRANGELQWVAWKGNQRLIMGLAVHRTINLTNGTGSRLEAANVSYGVQRIIAFDRDGSNPVDMFQGQLRTLLYGYGDVGLVDELPNDPNHVLLVANDQRGNGAWLGDTNTGHVERVADGSDYTISYTADGTGALVMRRDEIPDGSGERIYRKAPTASNWTLVMDTRHSPEKLNSPDFQIVGPGPGAGDVYVLARPQNTDLLSLYLYNTSTGDLGQPIAQSSGSDAIMPWVSRTTHQIVATCEDAERWTCVAHEPVIQRNLSALDSFFNHQAAVSLQEMSNDGGKWLLSVNGPTSPGGYYVYDVAQHRVEPIVPFYPNISEAVLSPTQVVHYQARDGTALWAYVTAAASQQGARPMVVLPHGGPEARDEFAYDSFVEFLASRGYVVLQPNFRGGSGFGTAFADAGRHQWGRRMQDDVTDAVHHMIDAGVADPRRICIVGGSYGGYAALAGVALTPDLYRCAVSIAGVTDLLEILRDSRAGGGQSVGYQYWVHSIGDPSSDHDALVATSPHLQASHIAAPVLLIHGEADAIVPIHQSEMMQAALNAAGHQTQFIRLPHEGHHWDTWSRDDLLTMYRAVDAFLAQNLGPAH